MSGKSNEELRKEAHFHGNEALRLFDEARDLQQKADLIKDIHQHHEAMKEVNSKDLEAIEHIRQSNKLSSELAKKNTKDAAKRLREIWKK